ncbi:MAG: hypothetical protein LUD17_01200 [Bacteroidales bacterium]|nr:hypothetical protein [Bacteroidales bacterium]
MIRFYSTTSFHNAIEKLLSAKRGVYKGVTDAVQSAFENLSMDDILNMRDMILMENDRVVIKLRMADKKAKLSKRDGYRLIYVAFKHEEVVGLLYVYPKRGPMQQINVSDEELTHLIDEFSTEYQNGNIKKWNN